MCSLKYKSKWRKKADKITSTWKVRRRHKIQGRGERGWEGIRPLLVTITTVPKYLRPGSLQSLGADLVHTSVQLWGGPQGEQHTPKEASHPPSRGEQAGDGALLPVPSHRNLLSWGQTQGPKKTTLTLPRQRSRRLVWFVRTALLAQADLWTPVVEGDPEPLTSLPLPSECWGLQVCCNLSNRSSF